MTAPRIGDLAQLHLFRAQAGRLRSDLAARGQELSTGQTADVARHLGGDTARLAALDRDLALSEPLRRNQAEAAARATAMQAALGRVRETTETLTATVRAAAQGNLPAGTAAASEAARGAFAEIASALDTAVAGRSLFAGAAPQGPALAPAEEMLDALRGAIGTETEAQAIADIVGDWFAPGGGFEAVGYRGADTPASPVPVGNGAGASLDIRADDPALRGTLAATALAALADDPALEVPPGTTDALLDRAGAALTASGEPLTELRARLGVEEARIERAGARLAAAREGAETARAALVEVDGYEAATRMQALGQNLESLYAVTARLSRLTLLEALR